MSSVLDNILPNARSLSVNRLPEEGGQLLTSIRKSNSKFEAIKEKY